MKSFLVALKIQSLLLIFLAKAAFGAEDPPLWEYGVGFGYVRFEHYPSSDEHTQLALPFPTFQYRGKILRADDRDGARLYLFKGEDFLVELAGGGNTPLNSSDNQAREGMENLPLGLQLGPQVVKKLNSGLELRFAVFQSFLVGERNQKTSGYIFEGKVYYSFEKELALNGISIQKTTGNLSLGMRTATRQYLATYFEVTSSDATPERPEYFAKSGILSQDISYFQSFHSGRFSYYVGASFSSYAMSANRESPLAKTSSNLSGLVGITYVLGESERRSVRPEETEGVINEYRRYRTNHPF